HRVERQRAGFLPRGDVDVGRRDGVELVLTQRLLVVLRKRIAQGLAASDIRTDPRLEQRAGRLARTESRDPNLAGDAAERGIESLVELDFVDLDGNLDLVPLEGFDARLHPPASVRGRSSENFLSR